MVAQVAEQVEMTDAGRKRTPKADKPRPVGASRFSYVFESVAPGIMGGQRFYIDYPPERYWEPDDDPAARREARVFIQEWERRWPDEKDRAVLKAAYEANRGLRIVFSKDVSKRMARGVVQTRIRYQTNDPNIAQAIRWGIEEGRLPGIREIDQSKVWVVGDAEFANNEKGRAAAEKYFDTHGGEMRLVKRGA